MSHPNQTKIIAMGLLGAAIGGCAGYFAFFWIVSQGFYALIVPPALLGLMAGFFARGRSNTLAAICGVAGLLLAFFTDWRFNPNDRSLPEYLMHVHELKPLKLIMAALGAFFSYRFALGHDRAAPSTSKSAPSE